MTNITQKPQFKKAWSLVQSGLVINNEKDYDRAIKVLNQLLDRIGDNQKHPLYGYLDTLGVIIENYERDHFAFKNCSGADVLRSLMEEHGLSQSDFLGIASQGVMSEILNGKRQLTLRQIKGLSRKFKISPAVFIDE